MRSPNDFIDNLNYDPNYWNNQQQQKWGNFLDNFYTARTRGQMQSQVREYALPKSQMTMLRENPNGGLPVFQGQTTSALPINFQFSQNHVKMPPELGGMSQMGMPMSVPNPAYDAASVDREIGPHQLQQMMQQRMMQQGYSPQQMTQNGMVNMPPQGAAGPRMASLVEGHIFFRPLQLQGFASTIPVVKTGGQIAGVKGQVQVHEVVRAYVADGLARIDASRLHEDASRIKMLVVVSAPWTNGQVLVPQEAIIENGYGTGGSQQLLTDARAYNIEQQSMIHNAQRQQLMQQQQRQQMLMASQRPAIVQQQIMPMQQQQRPVISSTDEASKALLRRRGLLKG